ncbi:MAG: hypothetical protein PVJ09_00055 [Candidatus Woesebacteria bacterium]|jgi:hypothetical protein
MGIKAELLLQMSEFEAANCLKALAEKENNWAIRFGPSVNGHSRNGSSLPEMRMLGILLKYEPIREGLKKDTTTLQALLAAFQRGDDTELAALRAEIKARLEADPEKASA